MSTQTVFVKAGATSVSVDCSLVQNAAAANPGDPKTALTYSDITAYYRVGATGTLTAITPATQTVGGAYSSGGFVKLSDSNAPGGYRLDVPNAVIPSTPGEANIWLSASGMATHHIKIIASAQVDVVSQLGTTVPPIYRYTATGGASNTVDLPSGSNVGDGDLLICDNGSSGIVNTNGVDTSVITPAIRATISGVWNKTNPSNGVVVWVVKAGAAVPLTASVNAQGLLKVALAALLDVALGATANASDHTGVVDVI